MRLLKNARIYTQDKSQPFAEAILINGERIVGLGKNDDFESLSQNNLDIIDLDGKTILPGLCDAHLHLAYLGKYLNAVNCETKTKAACLQRIKERVQQTPKGEWVYGHGWNQNNWESGYGTIQELDAISTEHPIFLTAKSLHAAWANSKAFERASITQDTPNPSGGEFCRDENGQLNGLMLENAYPLVEKAIPTPTDQEMAEILNSTQEHLWSMGITAVHDFDRIPGLRGLQRLETESRLKLRVYKTIPVNELDHFIQAGIMSGFGSNLIKFGPVKLFADGALGPHTAAMLAPYEGSNDQYGTLLLDAEEIFETGIKAAQNNLALAIHAIGDKANRIVLDGYEKLRQFEKEKNLPHPKHRIEHVQLIQPADIVRMQQLQVVASMQPIHLISDMDIADRLWGTRAKYAYTFKSIQDRQIPLIFGSDAPVESANPFIGMFSALLRTGLDGKPDTAWYPEQKLSLESIIEAYTITPASTANWLQSVGSLKANKFADLIILPTDPFTSNPDTLLNLKPTQTMVGGEWVWQSEVK